MQDFEETENSAKSGGRYNPRSLGRRFSNSADADDPWLTSNENRDASASFDSAKTQNLLYAEQEYDAPQQGAYDAYKNSDPSQTLEFPAIEEKKGNKNASQSFIAEGNAKKYKYRGKNFRTALIAIIAVLALTAAGFGSYAAELWGGKTVPEVTGMSAADAESELSAKGFKVEIEYVLSDDVEDVAEGTNPAAGSRAPEGSEIVLKVTKARIVPEIVGLPLAEAEKLLKESGYENVSIAKKKSDEATDTVLEVSPAAGSRAAATAAISVIASEPYTVPDISGMKQAEAVAAIEEAGYVATVQTRYTEDYPEDTAIGTEPAAGAVFKSGSTVTVVIAKSRGTELKSLTQSYLSAGQSVSMNGGSYEIGELVSVSYDGGNQCSFTVMMRVFQTVTWFDGETQTRYGEWQPVSGTIAWSDSNDVASIQPAMTKI